MERSSRSPVIYVQDCGLKLIVKGSWPVWRCHLFQYQGDRDYIILFHKVFWDENVYRCLEVSVNGGVR